MLHEEELVFRKHILDALRGSGWRIQPAASRLGIRRRELVHCLKMLHIDIKTIRMIETGLHVVPIA